MTTPQVMLNDTLRILIESSNYDSSDDSDSVESYDSVENKVKTIEERQGALCEELLRQLRNIQQPKSKERRRGEKFPVTTSKAQDTTTSIRLLFPNTKVSDLLPAVLTPLLNDRVDTQNLLPGTQDDTANEEILLNSQNQLFL